MDSFLADPPPPPDERTIWMAPNAFLKYIHSKLQYAISQILRQNSSDAINMGNGGRVAMHKVNIGCHYANYDIKLIQP